MAKFTKMAYKSADEMIFGTTKKPVKYGRDFELGGGVVYPEIVNHPRPGSEETKKSLMREYEKMTQESMERAVTLGFPGLQVELEHVWQMTKNPDWGGDIAGQTVRQQEDMYQKYGIKSAVRATIADNRKPEEENIRDCRNLELALATFESSAKNKADNLSMESVGGKEISDHSIARGDIRGTLFGIGVLGSRDMEFMWKQIVDIANKHGATPGGDTNCAQANVAMFMAGGMLDKSVSHVFAAVTRAIGAARTLTAYEMGAKGPTKDCAYEDPIIKAIAGIPIATEGKTCACAHADLQGNLIMAVTDLWSNEAVEYHDMFFGTTAGCFVEILGYDVALMNSAIALGKEKDLQEMMVYSDMYRDPHTYVVAPAQAYEIGKEIVANNTDYYSRARAGAICAAKLILGDEKMRLSNYEKEDLQRILRELESFPDKEADFIDQCAAIYKKSVPGFNLGNYGL